MRLGPTQQIFKRIRAMVSTGRMPRGEMIRGLLAMSVELDLDELLAQPLTLDGRDIRLAWQGETVNVEYAVTLRYPETTSLTMHDLKVTVRSRTPAIMKILSDEPKWEVVPQGGEFQISALPSYRVTEPAAGEWAMEMTFGLLSPGVYRLKHNFMAVWPEKVAQV